jgi:hypothetical protein
VRYPIAVLASINGRIFSTRHYRYLGRLSQIYLATLAGSMSFLPKLFCLRFRSDLQIWIDQGSVACRQAA